MYNETIKARIAADKDLALRLEKAASEVAINITNQWHNFEDGFTRLTWYTSCFTERYQDVCSKQKREDYRFGLGLLTIVKNPNIVLTMVLIYVDLRLKMKSESEKESIFKSLSKSGSLYASNTSLKYGLSILIAQTILAGFSLKSAIVQKSGKTASFILTGYGVVQEAANAANRLNYQCHSYYMALYEAKLEMMYFIIEPLFRKVVHNFHGDNKNIINDFRILAGTI